jgi:Zn-dependent protease with chaperone function
VGARYRIMIIRRDFFEAQILVERTGGFHVIEGIEEYVTIATDACGIHDGVSQLTAEAKTAKRWPDIKAFHLAGIRIVHAIKGAQGAAPGSLAIHAGHQQGAARFGILARERGQFLLKVLKAQVDLKARCILTENSAQGIERINRSRRDNIDGFGIHNRAQRMSSKFSVNSRARSKRASYRRLKLAVALSVGLLASACQTVQTTQPGTVGITRTQSMAVSAQEIDAASVQAYNKMLQEAARKKQLNPDPAMQARVQGIARKLIAQTPVFREDARRWRWEVNVFQSDEINAFCMAGGKIGVYAGLITRLQVTDSELAAVMGHEISHALREHVREQVSLQYATQLPGILLAITTGSRALGQLGDIVSDVTLGLPHSREAEAEADKMGVELAARAGYDPRGAITLWEKMTRNGGGRPPEFLSTHPAPETRAQDLARTTEMVMPLYRQSTAR